MKCEIEYLAKVGWLKYNNIDLSSINKNKMCLIIGIIIEIIDTLYFMYYRFNRCIIHLIT